MDPSGALQDREMAAHIWVRTCTCSVKHMCVCTNVRVHVRFFLSLLSIYISDFSCTCIYCTCHSVDRCVLQRLLFPAISMVLLDLLPSLLLLPFRWGQWRDILRACDFRKRQLGMGDVENISRTIVSSSPLSHPLSASVFLRLFLSFCSEPMYHYAVHLYFSIFLCPPLPPTPPCPPASSSLPSPHLPSFLLFNSLSLPLSPLSFQLTYCLAHFKGDEKIPPYIHRLIDPSEITEPGRDAEAIYSHFTEDDYLALLSKNPETLFQDDSYMKHLRRHAHK